MSSGFGAVNSGIRQAGKGTLSARSWRATTRRVLRFSASAWRPTGPAMSGGVTGEISSGGTSVTSTSAPSGMRACMPVMHASSSDSQSGVGVKRIASPMPRARTATSVLAHAGNASRPARQERTVKSGNACTDQKTPRPVRAASLCATCPATPRSCDTVW
ncbi:hypothetical protein BC477_11965 [Clavibacter michiganensis subsp. michiganensis]|uniref:Uncharacterized protein n=1 Tax=Clavibacter michiganensis subsp. michiganensis TaxID=33013 RepID=A0A251XIQ4_CLAMM|nr:hypothetical protein BC477_11965 [Clavibacter michiganensis subsp. michiganensis]OUE02511.1 hypothetical protein CMMCAS07_10875 [Clavibacter michiganensis subsp. michiganensis]